MTRGYFLLLLLVSLLHAADSRACGYGFIGGCSTNIGLRINGTADSFAVAPCPGITNFHGLELGVIQSLALIRAESVNWESCQNNVAVVSLYFRLFQTGTSGGAWQQLNLQEEYFTLAGPYTTRYQSISTQIDLATGLIPGQDYTLEAYFRAEVDTIGDDFIPETFIVQNNNGHNYRLTFRYGGASAPPFTVVKTRITAPACYGDTTGSIGVAVYGNQTGLFYHWSGSNDNFNARYNLPAGTYTLTVTGQGGYSAADTFELQQPGVVTNQFTNIVPLGCNNGVGQATAQAGGGTAPYSYQWENAQLSPTVAVLTPGNYTVNVSDVHGCTGVFHQFITGGNQPISQSIQVEICNGEIYYHGNQAFTQAGIYDFTLPGGTGCDTLVHLQLSVASITLETFVEMASGPLAANGSVLVDASGGTAPYAILWNTGHTGELLSQMLPGTYCVTLTDADGCTQDTCVVVSYASATRESASEKMRIVPSLATPGDELALQLPAKLLGEPLTIEIFDVAGRRLLLENRPVHTGTLQLSLPAHTPPGLLLLRVSSPRGQVLGRCMAR